MNHKEMIEKGIETLCDGLNSFNFDENVEVIFSTLQNQHRTIQQNFWRAIFKTMERYASDADFDLRNEASVENCRKVSMHGKEDPFLFPYI